LFFFSLPSFCVWNSFDLHSFGAMMYWLPPFLAFVPRRAVASTEATGLSLRPRHSGYFMCWACTVAQTVCRGPPCLKPLPRQFCSFSLSLNTPFLTSVVFFLILCSRWKVPGCLFQMYTVCYLPLHFFSPPLFAILASFPYPPLCF